MEPTPTRLVWITLLATMNQDGFCQFASIANLAHRAVLSIEDTKRAIDTLEAADPESSDPEHAGRRIERVPGGWIVLNAMKYRELATREMERERTRLRVAAYRERQRSAKSNGQVTPHNEVETSL